MNGLSAWIVFAWIALPTVMYGGYSLLGLINRGNVLTPFQVTWFRAGPAHAGILVLISLLYYTFMDKTAFPRCSSMQRARYSSWASWLNPEVSLST